MGGGSRIGRDEDNDSSDDSDFDNDSNCNYKQGFLGCNNGRFPCSICLKAVSDKPVVTRCIHLYCWLCLYTWLEPSINNHKYSTTFQGGGGSGGTRCQILTATTTTMITMRVMVALALAAEEVEVEVEVEVGNV